MVVGIPVTKSFDPNVSHPYVSAAFKRRDPNLYFYLPIECPSLKTCTDGTCPLSHTKLEMMFHPLVYKTRKCKMMMEGICKFSGQCTFYNNESDRMAAQLLWLIWEKRWDLWRHNIEAVLNAHNKLVEPVTRNLSMVKNYRGNMKQIMHTINRKGNGRNLLDGRLDALLRLQFSTSCGEPEAADSIDLY
ncbi:uncharacterized protein BBOV_IV008860 [Babesia bovis T2Bo]|uniref:C3H1-type domain-containing protein n=1 Tax=Babesia bovis TaxID=5865 RepID=A7ARS0_BABBO|nr:uncharacterized protein BBOV_IV008850 [Babesia bovis T2Bo]XP_001610808.1 uncharacterized protein BBOV_IV008860 [Babesia bovis T2Bo]EDO07239.1 hypothetical protein BBOV_IV008850 [Babesia bovis T2Bo]EDO07240.1 hypothetical protein BBOV_IV008860 [Babesia bovis T2Bo]|eukprot:XP_001610807.1 hypothetical protein [Babesia bovis T2Bo]